MRLICSGKCTTLDDLSNRVCVPNETEDLNLHVVNMITGTNESLFMHNFFFFNPVTYSCKYGKYAEAFIGDSVVICNEIINTIKTVPTKSTSPKAVLKISTSTNFYILLAFLLITIAYL